MWPQRGACIWDLLATGTPEGTSTASLPALSGADTVFVEGKLGVPGKRCCKCKVFNFKRFGVLSPWRSSAVLAHFRYPFPGAEVAIESLNWPHHDFSDPRFSSGFSSWSFFPLDIFPVLTPALWRDLELSHLSCDLEACKGTVGLLRGE